MHFRYRAIELDAGPTLWREAGVTEAEFDENVLSRLYGHAVASPHCLGWVHHHPGHWIGTKCVPGFTEFCDVDGLAVDPASSEAPQKGKPIPEQPVDATATAARFTIAGCGLHKGG